MCILTLWVFIEFRLNDLIPGSLDVRIHVAPKAQKRLRTVRIKTHTSITTLELEKVIRDEVEPDCSVNRISITRRSSMFNKIYNCGINMAQKFSSSIQWYAISKMKEKWIQMGIVVTELVFFLFFCIIKIKWAHRKNHSGPVVNR